MANHLKMAIIHAISALLRRGWSHRRIALELGINRETVSRYARLAASNPAKAPPGSGPPLPPDSDPGGDSKPAKAPPGSTGLSGPPAGAIARRPPRQASACEGLRDIIQAKLNLGLSAQRIHQDLVAEHGFQARYHSVRRFVKRLNPSRPLPFRRMECDPGQEAQIDFGAGAPIIRPDGRRKRTHVFRIVLSHSRKAYSQVVYRQTTDNFIQAIEDAFWYFGGVPRTLVIDNLKAAVTKADWFDPELNPKLRAFAEHYDTVILPAKPYTPRHKGKIERNIGYVKENGLKGRTFSSLEEQNRHLHEWEASVADTRIHGTTRRQVGRVFSEVERPTLRPLPQARFPDFREARRKTHRDGHVELQKAYYSVPPEYTGRELWVRWDGRIVRIFNGRMEQIAVHVRHEPGRFSTHAQHIPGEKISGVERGAAWLLNKAGLIGSETQQWAEAMVQERGIQGIRVLQGLLALAHKHPCDLIETACRIAHSHGAYRLQALRELIRHQADKQERFAFADEHPIIRSLSEYEALVRESFVAESHDPGEAPLAVPGDTGSAGFPRPLPWASFPSTEGDET